MRARLTEKPSDYRPFPADAGPPRAGQIGENATRLMTDPCPALRLLVVEDSELDYDLLVATLMRDPALAPGRIRAQRVEDEDSMRDALARGPVDAVITDHNMPRFDSFAALKVAKSCDENLPVLVVSGEMSEELAVAALHAGADDFILKSRMFRIGPALRRGLEAAVNRKERRAQAQRLLELTAHLERVKEEERHRLAREVHDDIGTTLTALKFELARLSRDPPPGNDNTAHLKSMQDLLSHAIAASHRIQHNLRPPVLDAGLVAALDWMVGSVRARGDFEVTFESNRTDIALAAEKSAALYRAAQESLTNVSKHAQAHKVAVTLFEASEEITLEIADDGVGFDAGLLKATPGFGLRGMIERARALGGWAEIDSQPGAGTTVMFSLPRMDAPALHAPAEE